MDVGSGIIDGFAQQFDATARERIVSIPGFLREVAGGKQFQHARMRAFGVVVEETMLVHAMRPVDASAS